MPCPNSARKRSVTMAFRMTPEDRDRICRLAQMSGMNRQDYIMAKLSDCTVRAAPNVRLLKGLKDSIKDIYLELRRVQKADEINPETLAVLLSLTEILKDLGAYDKDEVSDTEQESMDIINMSRE